MKISKKIPSMLILFSGIFLFSFSFSDVQLIPVDAQEFRQAPDYKAIALDGTPVSINERSWKYGDTQALIFTAQVIDGELVRVDNPINESDAKSLTNIDSDNGLVSIVWTETDNSVKITTAEN